MPPKKRGFGLKPRTLPATTIHNICTATPKVAPVNMAKFDELYLVRWPSWWSDVAGRQWWPWSAPTQEKDVSWHSIFWRQKSPFTDSRVSLSNVWLIHGGVISIECLQLCPIPADFVDLSGHPPRSWKSVTPIWRSSVERPGTWALKWAQLGYPQRWCDYVTWHPEDVSLTPLHINTLLYNLLVGMKLLGWVTERSSCCPYLFLGHPKNYMFWRPEDGCQISILDPTSVSILMRLWRKHRQMVAKTMEFQFTFKSEDVSQPHLQLVFTAFPFGIVHHFDGSPMFPPFFKAVHGESFAGIYTLQGSIIEISSPPIAWWIRPRPNTRRSLAVHRVFGRSPSVTG